MNNSDHDQHGEQPEELDPTDALRRLLAGSDQASTLETVPEDITESLDSSEGDDQTLGPDAVAKLSANPQLSGGAYEVERISGSEVDEEDADITALTPARGSGLQTALKPDGHWNKPLIAALVLGSLFLFFVFMMPSGETEEPKIQNITQKLPDQVDELTAVSPGTEALSSNSSSETPILGDDILNANVDSNSSANSPFVYGSNTNQNVYSTGPTQPITTTSTSTTYVPVESTPAQQSPTYSQYPRPTPRVSVSEEFTVDMDSPSQGRVPAGNNSAPLNEVPVRQLRIMPGSRIKMALNEPFRSGIETRVQATALANIKGIDGNILLPAGSIFEFTFRSDEVNGRVLNREQVRVFLNDGTIGEIIGGVKGTDGYAGLGGKVTKQGGGIGSAILKGAARVGGRIVGQSGVGSDIQSEIENSGIGDRDTTVSRSNRIVEVKSGTQFYLVVGTP